MYGKYKRSKRYTKRKSYRKHSNLTKKIANIAKKVALRTQETKHAIHSLLDRNVYHNNSYLLSSNLVQTSQGVNDSGHRIGDEITLRGIKVYIKMEDVWDRPNTTFRFVIAKCRQGIAGSLTLPTVSIMGVPAIDPVDMEQCMKVYANRRYRFGDKDTLIDVGNEGVGALSRPTTHFRTIWIPLNNSKYKFLNQNSTQGTAYNIAMWCAVYDHSSMLTLDQIGKVTVSWELFFKDG